MLERASICLFLRYTGHMKKIITIIARVVLGLLMVSPIVGILGIMPAPTADLYNTQIAFEFIMMLMDTGYVMWIMAAVFLVAIILTIMNRMALVALLILPITVNILAFHAFVDGGLFTAGAIMADVLLILNVYFLWQSRHQYKALLTKSQ